ncbi:MAG: outer membrane beta-barrel protein [Acidobacteriota bacterium]
MPVWHSSVAILLALSALLTLGASPSTAADHHRSIELAFVPESTSSDGPDVDGFGVRYSHRFDGVWGVQAAYYRDDVTFGDDDEMLEISARLRFFENDRTEVFGYFGGGILRYERLNFDPAANTIGSLGSDELVSAHVGLGVDIAVGERVFIRPDFVYRRFNDLFSPRDDEDTRASVAVGYRF